MDWLIFLFMFALGSMAGWIIELVYRSFGIKKAVNPGFLRGPYLPIYGFGIIFLFWISSSDFSLAVKVLLFMASTTLLELVTGLFFQYMYNIRLWDYSDNILNFKGIICLLFSFYWTLLSLIFYFLAYPLLNTLISITSFNLRFSFFLGIFYGFIILDMSQSFELARRIKEFADELQIKRIKQVRIDYDNLKQNLMGQLKRTGGMSFFNKITFSLTDVFPKDLKKSIEIFFKERFKK